MKLSRRDCLKAGALSGGLAALSGCSSMIRRYTGPAMPASIALPAGAAGAIDEVARVVNRVSFGPTPNEIARVTRLGIEGYVEEQLAAEPNSVSLANEPAGLQWRVHGLEALYKSAYDLRDLPESEVIGQISRASLLFAVYSPWQLRERMVDFWSNHFNIFARKGMEAYLQPVDQVRIIRKHALGSFPDMLRASAKSPAMLCYLDNQVNRKGRANENYARELMELHTLGVHGGYTQRDVQEVARCFTGWTMEERFLRPKGAFRFDEEAHDYGAKVVLGHAIPPGGGVHDGERVLDILAAHPATARFIGGKVARYFLGEQSGAWPERLAEIYLRTDGDIVSMLRPLLLSGDLRSGPPILKRPFDYVVSSLRALNADTDGGPEVQDHLANIGQSLYLWPMPDGYPDKTAAWTGSLLARWNFAAALAGGGMQVTRIDLPALVKASGAESDSACADALTGLVLGRKPESEQAHEAALKVREHIARSPRADNAPVLADATALLLASPAFQWR